VHVCALLELLGPLSLPRADVLLRAALLCDLARLGVSLGDLFLLVLPRCLASTLRTLLLF
jgi:hypothetical protein